MLQPDIDLLGDLTLETHEVMVTLLHHLFGNLLPHCCSGSVLLLGVGKDSHLIESLLLHKATQRLILGVGLPREANDECRANRDSRDACPQLCDQLLHPRPCIGTIHRTQHGIMRMLQRQIDILDHLWLSGKDLDQLIGKILWIAV